MTPKGDVLTNLPAYTTVTAQSFSKNGEFLAVGSDEGVLAIYKMHQVFEKDGTSPLVFHTEAASALDETNARSKGCITAMKTFNDTLIVAISRPVTNEAAIVAFYWKDLIQQRSKLIWSIESSSGVLPSDVNCMDVSEDDEKLFVVGGVGTCANEPIKDFGVHIVDIETRREVTKPFLGHLGYLHAVQFCPATRMLATCGEDGSVRTWDFPRTKKSCISFIEPHKETALSVGENVKIVQPRF